MKNKPLITIITAVYNGDKYLEQTIQSIINQTYSNLEYIIIDGGSTDRTVEIIKKYADKISYWITEPDKGISDAFNKGVKVSKGEYLNFQGDGDGFISDSSIEDMISQINDDKVSFLSARIQRIDIDENIIYRSKFIKKFNKRSLLFKMALPHQGLFTHKDYFKKYGLFDINNIFCMDYDHLLRAYSNFPKIITLDIIISNWRDDGLGNGRTLEIFKEYDKIKRQNKVASTIILTYIKYWTLFKFYLKKVL